MNKAFVITTDNNCDLPEEYLKQHEMGVLYLGYTMAGKTYGREKRMPDGEFYAAMRKGELPTTSAINFEDAKSLFSQYMEQGLDVLHVAFSSALSGSCSVASAAAREAEQEHPGRKVIVVDSLCASLGQGLLLHKLSQKREEGASLEETARWAEENRLHVCHNFTVDDLFHLHRGGRVSKATAILGSLINIKPVLHVDDEGRLVPVGKARGRKNSLLALVDNMEKQLGDMKNDIIFISHGDCLEDAQFVQEEIRRRMGIENFLIHYVGPSIGAHSGPGTVALFFMGEKR